MNGMTDDGGSMGMGNKTYEYEQKKPKRIMALPAIKASRIKSIKIKLGAKKRDK